MAKLCAFKLVKMVTQYNREKKGGGDKGKVEFVNGNVCMEADILKARREQYSLSLYRKKHKTFQVVTVVRYKNQLSLTLWDFFMCYVIKQSWTVDIRIPFSDEESSFRKVK